ncbi:MAG: hypothetical protein QGD94_04350 [Planctomycetia bacterium]|nr:hypothetical protein [Planctomycetia bacterium]
MGANKVVVALDEEELLELHAAVIDGDAEAALAFLRARIVPKVPARGTAACDSSRRNPYLLRPDSSA